LCDLLKKHKEDAAKKERSRIVEKTFVSTSDRISSVRRRYSVTKDRMDVIKERMEGIQRSRA
jgi:hypothetical protein